MGIGDATIGFRSQQHRDRWSGFGADAGLEHLSERPSVEELKSIEVFQDYPDAFLERISPDVSIATWAKDAVLFEEGSYIDLAFYVLAGEVGVYLSEKSGEASPAPIFTASRAPRAPAAGLETVYVRQADLMEETGERMLLSVMDFDLPTQVSRVSLGVGELFGEIGALSGWPQSVTARTLTECRLVQIRLPALRLMKRQSKALKARLDTRYRERSLLPQLHACPLLEECPEAELAGLAQRSDLMSCSPGEVVVEEGAPIDAVYLVRSGFMKLSQQVGRGQRTVSYLSKGMTFGDVEFLIEGLDGARFSVASVGYSELVKIPTGELRKLLPVVPSIEKRLWQDVVDRIKTTGATRIDSERSEFVEVALDEGLVQGNSILVIDLDRCTRCDDCVRACADTHDGRPRFVREGERQQNLLVAKSCYHCQDPVCLVGCPTGAIRRANVGDVVEIKETICIGCGTCAGNCPYDAIVMHDTGTVWPGHALPKSLRGEPRAVASKCDLCHTSAAGPACVRNCPHACAFRVGSLEEFERLQTRGRTRT